MLFGNKIEQRDTFIDYMAVKTELVINIFCLNILITGEYIYFRTTIQYEMNTRIYTLLTRYENTSE